MQFWQGIRAHRSINHAGSQVIQGRRKRTGHYSGAAAWNPGKNIGENDRFRPRTGQKTYFVPLERFPSRFHRQEAGFVAQPACFQVLKSITGEYQEDRQCPDMALNGARVANFGNCTSFAACCPRLSVRSASAGWRCRSHSRAPRHRRVGRRRRSLLWGRRARHDANNRIRRPRARPRARFSRAATTGSRNGAPQASGPQILRRTRSLRPRRPRIQRVLPCPLSAAPGSLPRRCSSLRRCRFYGGELGTGAGRELTYLSRTAAAQFYNRCHPFWTAADIPCLYRAAHARICFTSSAGMCRDSRNSWCSAGAAFSNSRCQRCI